MAKPTSDNDYVCRKCGCSISIVEEPSKSGYHRGTTYCPVCQSQMVQRFRLNPPVSVESLTEKFGVTDYSDVRKIRERLGHARALLNHVSVKGTVGASTIYGVLSEDRNDIYVVTKKGGFWTCNCPDHVFRHGACKHIIAAMLVEEKSGINPFK